MCPSSPSCARPSFARFAQFYSLMRHVLREALRFLHAKQWSTECIASFAGGLTDKLLKKRPDGPRRHVAAIYVDEVRQCPRARFASCSRALPHPRLYQPRVPIKAHSPSCADSAAHGGYGRRGRVGNGAPRCRHRQRCAPSLPFATPRRAWSPSHVCRSCNARGLLCHRRPLVESGRSRAGGLRGARVRPLRPWLVGRDG